jgi:hypothetical protein
MLVKPPAVYRIDAATSSFEPEFPVRLRGEFAADSGAALIELKLRIHGIKRISAPVCHRRTAHRWNVSR